MSNLPSSPSISPLFSVVIPTYNRASLVGRAIESVLAQDWPDIDVIVVDDVSPDDTESVVRRRYPQVRYLRQNVNGGPGPARQRGIRESRHPWVLLLDDDDKLENNALQSVAEEMANRPETGRYPVLMFAHGTGSMPESFRVMNLDDYGNGTFRGDFVSIIQRDTYLSAGLCYPATRLGGESLLWMNVAARFGLPMWSLQIASVGKDADQRLTSARHQVRHAEEHACLQESILAEFGESIAVKHPAFVCRRHLGAATYWLLTGQRWRAATHVRYLATHSHKREALTFWLLSYLPLWCVRWSFLAFRQLSQVRSPKG
jgi:GalNAc5-diNAcBac-PP-undecaprenol beta-1,3-glucosyltransferase